MLGSVLAALFLWALLWAQAALAAGQTIVVVGDSLSSGYGVAAEQSWVSLLEHRLQAEGYGYEVVNASISGDTTAGGLSRLPRLLETYQPTIVVIELGGNDGLRGQPVTTLRQNLARMIELVQAREAAAILTGIQIPPNYGPSYTRALEQVYPELAQEYGIALVDFLMDRVAREADLMQSDGIHPNAAGHEIMFENVWSVLAPLL